MNKEKAIIYTRVSTEEQAVEGRHSLNAQKRLCEESIEKGGVYELANDGEYTDPGRSATNMNRPGLQDLLIRIQDDPSIKAIFVQDTDRLARNAADHMAIRALFHKQKIKLISVSQPGIEDTPEGNFMDIIIAGVNQFTSQITGRKSSKGMEEQFRSGWLPTKAPLGYINVASPENEEKRIIVPDPVRAPLIEEAFRVYATGNYSLLEVRDMFYKKGLTNHIGNPLARSQIAMIMENPFYYGELHWKELVGVGKHVHLTTKEIFQKCLQVKDEHNGFRCRKRKHNFLLRGFIYCFACGKRWTAEKQIKKDKSYYRCNAQPTTVRCEERYIESKNLEQQIADRFTAIEFSQEFIDRIVAKAQSLYQEKRSGHDGEKQALLAQKNNLMTKLETAEEKLISGILSDEDFSRIKIKLHPLIGNIDDEIAKLERARNIRVDVIQKLLHLVRNIGQSYSTASPELKRLYLGLFWTKFEVAGGKIQKSTLTDVMQQLIALGRVKEVTEDTTIQPKAMFNKPTPYFGKDIRITTVRGG